MRGVTWRSSARRCGENEAVAAVSTACSMHRSRPSRRAATISSARPRRRKTANEVTGRSLLRRAAVLVAVVQHQVAARRHVDLAPAQAVDLAPAPGHLDRERMHHPGVLGQPRQAAEDACSPCPTARRSPGGTRRWPASRAAAAGREARSGSCGEVRQPSREGDACHGRFSITSNARDRDCRPPEFARIWNTRPRGEQRQFATDWRPATVSLAASRSIGASSMLPLCLVVSADSGLRVRACREA